HLPPPYVSHFAAQEVEICRHHVHSRMERGDSLAGRFSLTGRNSARLARGQVGGTCRNSCCQDGRGPCNELRSHVDHVPHTWHVALALSSGTGVGPAWTTRTRA